MKKHIGLSVAVAVVSMFVFVAPALAATISRELDLGTSGADVTTLQATLAMDVSIYPEGRVTGYFGPLTFAAVKRFQAQQGLPQVGRVGPLTMAAFNRVYGNVGAAPAIFNASTTPSSTSANVTWTTNQSATGIVYYSATPLVVSEASGPGQNPIVTGAGVQTANTSLSTTNSVVLPNLVSATTYYYTIVAINGAGQMSMTWPSMFRTR